MRLLLAEDNSILRDGMLRSLQQNGFVVDSVSDGLEAECLLSKNEYDLLILDLGLPGQDGLSVLGKLRSHDAIMPVLIITARDSITDRVKGLDLGADDYLSKPFDLAEFEARVRALVRRGLGGQGKQLNIGELRLDVSGQRAYLAGEPVELTARELGVLEVLMRRAGQVVNKESLIEKLTGWDEEIGPNAIEVYVHRLRKKLDPLITIRTIRGLGYLLEKE